MWKWWIYLAFIKHLITWLKNQKLQELLFLETAVCVDHSSALSSHELNQMFWKIAKEFFQTSFTVCHETYWNPCHCLTVWAAGRNQFRRWVTLVSWSSLCVLTRGRPGLGSPPTILLVWYLSCNFKIVLLSTLKKSATWFIEALAMSTAYEADFHYHVAWRNNWMIWQKITFYRVFLF